MTYDAYKLMNLDDFLALDVPSHSITGIFGALGKKEVLVTRGNAVSILFDGIFLSLELNSKNPFEFEDHAAFLDPDRNIWIGVKHED